MGTELTTRGCGRPVCLLVPAEEYGWRVWIVLQASRNFNMLLIGNQESQLVHMTREIVGLGDLTHKV